MLRSRSVVSPLCFCPRSPGRKPPGTLDTSFVSASVGSTFYALTLETVSINGVNYPIVVVGGDLTALNELNSNDGSDFADFELPAFGNDNGRIIYTIVPEVVPVGSTSHNLLLGGLFGRSPDQVTAMEPAQNITRLFPDGTQDATFNPGKGSDNYITAILPLPDGGMVVGGEFVLFNKVTHNHIVRLDHTGAIVSSSVFDPKLTFDDYVLSIAAQVNPDPTGPQGQILVAGTFGNVDGQPHSKLARINADGSVDESFKPDFGDRVTVVVCQPDGKILAGGYFQSVNGTAVQHIVRLNYDGSIDPTFTTQVTTMQPMVAAPVAVNTITPVGDGRYYIGGNFLEINGVKRSYLGRVLPDGSVDSFDPGTTITNTVQQVMPDPATNRVYVTETLSKSINDVSPPSLIRLFGDPVVPIVSIKSQRSVAKEIAAPKEGGPGTKPDVLRGIFRLQRTGTNLDQPLTVYLALGGTGAAQLGTDYTIPSLQHSGGLFTITFPAKTDALKIHVVPSGKTSSFAPETITLTVQPDQAGSELNATEKYDTTDPDAATVTLKNASHE